MEVFVTCMVSPHLMEVFTPTAPMERQDSALCSSCACHVTLHTDFVCEYATFDTLLTIIYLYKCIL